MITLAWSHLPERRSQSVGREKEDQKFQDKRQGSNERRKMVLTRMMVMTVAVIVTTMATSFESCMNPAIPKSSFLSSQFRANLHLSLLHFS